MTSCTWYDATGNNSARLHKILYFYLYWILGYIDVAKSSTRHKGEDWVNALYIAAVSSLYVTWLATKPYFALLTFSLSELPIAFTTLDKFITLLRAYSIHIKKSLKHEIRYEISSCIAQYCVNSSSDPYDLFRLPSHSLPQPWQGMCCLLFDRCLTSIPAKMSGCLPFNISQSILSPLAL